MATDIDLALAQIGQAPVPVALAAIDGAVLAGLARRKQELESGPRLMGIAAFALALGLAGGSISGGAPGFARSVSPLAPASALAPSALLDVRP